MLKIIWTLEEIKLLICLYKIKPSIQYVLIKLPNKTYESIRWKLYKLGLKQSTGDKFKKITYDKPKADVKNRRCLKCNKEFVSYNYLCRACKNKNKDYQEDWII